MKKAAEITLRPFERSDFKRLISWVPTPEAVGQWCGSFFGYPSLTEDERWLPQRWAKNALPYSDAAKRSVSATTAALMPKASPAQPTMTSSPPGVRARNGVAIAGGQKTALARRDGNSCARFSIPGVGCWSLEGRSGWDQMDRRASRAVAGVLRASGC
jgi:hypothetical protein